MFTKLINMSNDVRKSQVKDLLNLKSIEEDRIILSGGEERRIIKFNTLNPLTANESECAAMVDRLNNALIRFNEDVLVRSLNMNLDLEKNLDYWLEIKKREYLTTFEKDIVNNIIYNIKQSHDNKEIPNKEFFFIYRIKKDDDFESKELDLLDSLNIKGEAKVLKGEELKRILFKDFNVFDKNSKVIKNKKIMHSKYLKDNDITEDFTLSFLPNNIKFLPDQVNVNEKKVSLYGLTGGKDIVDFGDFLSIAFKVNIDIAIIFTNQTIYSSSLNEQIDKTDVLIDMAVEDNKPSSEVNRLEEKKEMIKIARDQVDKEGEKIIHSNIIFRFYSDSKDYKKDFNNSKVEIESLGYSIQNITNFQKEAYMNTSVLFHKTKVLDDTSFDLAMSSGSLINTYPFISQVSTKSDEAIPFCFNKNNVVTFDPLNDPKELNAANNNMVIIGQSGKGKTTVIKKMIMPEIIKRRKVFIIDPESEFSQLGKALKGKIIKPRSNKINPLQPKVLEYLNDDDKLVKVSISEYIPNVLTFLRCLKPDFDKDLTIKVLEETYRNKGIDIYTDLSTLKATDYPIFDDVFKTIFLYLFKEEDYERYMSDKKTSIFDFDIKSNATEFTKYDLEKMLRFFESLTSKGTYGIYFNGHTTLNLDKEEKLYIFDIFNVLMSKDEGLISAMYFNILSFIEYGATANKTEKSIVIADEVHLMLKGKLGFVVDYLESFAKRLRKNDSCQWLITQDLKDFTAKEIEDKAKKILSNAPIKMIMGLEQTQTEELKEIYTNLTEKEIMLIESSNKGEGLFMIGDQKFNFSMIFNKEELKLISFNPEIQELKKLIAKAESINMDIEDIFYIDDVKEQINALELRVGEQTNIKILREENEKLRNQLKNTK